MSLSACVAVVVINGPAQVKFTSPYFEMMLLIGADAVNLVLLYKEEVMSEVIKLTASHKLGAMCWGNSPVLLAGCSSPAFNVDQSAGCCFGHDCSVN